MVDFIDSIPVRNALLGEGIGPIFLDQLMCNGREASLLECLPSQNIGFHNCHHSEDAGVKCEGLCMNREHMFHERPKDIICYCSPSGARLFPTHSKCVEANYYSIHVYLLLV